MFAKYSDRAGDRCGAGWKPAAPWQGAFRRLQIAGQRRLTIGAQDIILPHRLHLTLFCKPLLERMRSKI